MKNNKDRYWDFLDQAMEFGLVDETIGAYISDVEAQGSDYRV